MFAFSTGASAGTRCRVCGKRAGTFTPPLVDSVRTRRAAARILPQAIVSQDRNQYAPQPRPQERQLPPFQQQSLQFQEPSPSVAVPAAALPAPLARRNQYLPVQNQRVYLQLSQVLNLPIITRTSGKNLGRVVNMLVDPTRREVVSLDLEDKKGQAPARSATVPLSSLRQIGDVVLVHDESAAFMDDRMAKYGCIYLTGLEVRTRSGRFLGKVRDYYFSPDNGEISRIVFDNFGLTFLPVTFFDCFSISAADILMIGRSEVLVPDEAEMRQRKESSGVFGIIPNLLKSVNTGQQVLTVDAYRPDAYLPRDYSYDQWMRDLRRWEQETGMTYEQYKQMEAQRGAPRPAANALLPARGTSPYMGGSAPVAPLPAARQPDYPQQRTNPYYQQAQPRQQPYPASPSYPAYPPQQDPRTRSPPQLRPQGGPPGATDYPPAGGVPGAAPGTPRGGQSPDPRQGMDPYGGGSGPGPAANPAGGYAPEGLQGGQPGGAAAQGYAASSNGMPAGQQGYAPGPMMGSQQQGYYGGAQGGAPMQGGYQQAPGMVPPQSQPQQSQQSQQAQQQQQQQQQQPAAEGSR